MSVTDEYDEIMASTSAVADCLVNALADTNKTNYAQRAAELIQQIEKNRGPDRRSLQMKLASLIVDATTDDAFKTADGLAERGPE